MEFHWFHSLVCMCVFIRYSSSWHRCQCNMCTPIKCSMWKEETPITLPVPCKNTTVAINFLNIHSDTHRQTTFFSKSLISPCFLPPRFPSSRSSNFPYTDTPLYTQTTAAQYYEAPPTSGSQASTPGTPLTVSVTTGTTGGVSMFVAQPTSAAGGGATVVTTGGTTNGAGDGAGTNGGAAGSYVIQGGYMLGSNSGGAGANSQSYSHTARASPATVSITEGEESSVPSADKKVCRGAKRRNLFSFCSHPHNPSGGTHWWRHSWGWSRGKHN